MEKEIDLFENFRRNLELLRIDIGLSTEEMSVKLGMTKKRIVDMEYGKKGRGVPKAQELFSIANFLGVSVEDLVHKRAKVLLN